MIEKECKYCFTTKPLSEFVKHNLCSDGTTGKCKVCKNLQRKFKYIKVDFKKERVLNIKETTYNNIFKPSSSHWELYDLFYRLGADLSEAKVKEINNMLAEEKSPLKALDSLIKEMGLEESNYKSCITNRMNCEK